MAHQLRGHGTLKQILGGSVMSKSAPRSQNAAKNDSSNNAATNGDASGAATPAGSRLTGHKRPVPDAPASNEGLNFRVVPARTVAGSASGANAAATPKQSGASQQGLAAALP